MANSVAETATGKIVEWLEVALSFRGDIQNLLAKSGPAAARAYLTDALRHTNPDYIARKIGDTLTDADLDDLDWDVVLAAAQKPVDYSGA